jgi:hypothetical protein
VIVHEVETRQPLDYFLHEEPVYGISVHPLNPDLFVTACSDGRLLLYDMRQVNINLSAIMPLCVFYLKWPNLVKLLIYALLLPTSKESKII